MNLSQFMSDIYHYRGYLKEKSSECQPFLPYKNGAGQALFHYRRSDYK